MKIRAIQVRLTEAEYAALKKIAVKKGYMFRSTTARMAIKQYIIENMEVTA